MADVKLEHPFTEIHGSIAKNGIVNRQKKYRDDCGHVIHEGKQEAYSITRPRDFKKTPKQGAELANHNLWSEACRRTSQILQAGQPGGPTETQLAVRSINKIPDYYTLEEAQTLLSDFRHRFQAQLPNTRGKHPDPQAPLDSTTGQGKRYSQLPNFIRAIIYHTLKSQLQNTHS